MANDKEMVEVVFDEIIVDDESKYDAMLLDFGGKQKWIPYSIIGEIDESGNTIEIQKWKAYQEELI